jgi:hypothetical protein
MARSVVGQARYRFGSLLAVFLCLGILLCWNAQSAAQSGSTAGADPNIQADGSVSAEGSVGTEALSGTITATFPGPLSSFSINLTIANNTQSPLRKLVLTGRFIRPLAIIWDSMGSFSSASGVTLNGCTGVDTDTVVCSFTGFEPGRSGTFSGIDPDYEGDPSAGITVGDLAGVRSIAVAGGVGTGKFVVSGSNVVATIQ